MKKSIIAISAVLLMISTTAWAGKGKKAHKPRPDPVQATFQSEFKGAEAVKWTDEADYTSASFVLNNSHVIAYFDYSGELLGTARNVLFDQLPLSVSTVVNQRYPTAIIYNIIEITNGSGTFYKMLAETPTHNYKLNVLADGDLSVESKTKK
jgi:hypothetical protein